MQKLHCPHCRRELEKEFFRKKILFRCAGCGGQYLTVSALRGLCQSKEFVNTLWRNALHSKAPGVPCPECGKPTRQVLLYPDINTALELDVCTVCNSVWFDPAELDTIPAAEPPKEELPPEAKEAIAAFTIARIRETAQSQEDFSFDIWKILPGLLGLPVEENSNDLQRLPLLTWAAAAVCVIVFLLTFKDLNTAAAEWGFIPKEMFRLGGATWLTSMILHANWLHLVGNVYFLLVFGDNVEDEFGHLKYLLLILSGGICATLTHALTNLSSTIPCVGASGFISAILACYAIYFPRRTLGISFGRFINRISLPAWSVFLIWMLFQIVAASCINTSGGGTAYFAHIGGAAAGLIFAAAGKLYHSKSALNSAYGYWKKNCSK